MRDLPSTFANNLWQLSCTPAWLQFQRAAMNVQAVQRRILRDNLRANRNTAYGRRFGFASIDSVESFQENVPITTYEDYLEPIEAIGQGQPNILTAEPVRMFEVTSGSTSASKLIPYTRSLRSEFQRAIAAWIVDLFGHHPDLKKGPAYWSITPLIEGRQTTSGGIPIGFEEDSAYLGPWGRNLLDTVLAVPGDVKNAQSMEAFRYTTLLYLLRQPELRLISVWNPTFLSLLLDPLAEWWPALIKDIDCGTLSPPDMQHPDVRRSLLRRLAPDPHRASVLASIQPDDYQAIWPRLGLISCWMDGSAATYAQALQALFPNVLFQGKGLIATEAFVSFPMIGTTGSVLAVTSHFFEFLPVDPQTFSLSCEQPQPAHRLEKGRIYSVVVTTGGDLYRYHLHDLVKVVGHLHQVPCLQFLGKGDKVSDWFGEKLHEQFVANVLEDLFREHSISPVFAMLAPEDTQQGFRYTLYLELAPQERSRESLVDLAQDLDRKLGQNFHYGYCRRLGQLAEPEIFRIDQGATQAYLRACEAQGQRLGDIKPSALQRTTGWGQYFSNQKKVPR
ncbi:MAG: GH3 auxin-responsive promoter family protein [Planctomycetota bacterium]